MLKLGFHMDLSEKVLNCIFLVEYSILLDEKVIGSITPQRDPRQGDPMSLYLFLLCMEGLSGLINLAPHGLLSDGLWSLWELHEETSHHAMWDVLRYEVVLKWPPPLAGSLKVNTDAAIDTSRNCSGLGMVCLKGCLDPKVVEVLALQHAMI
uniref:Uncharacterized protein n=1 Tax=Cannabis sativa TaxID=3483 RepID=A0A803QKF0_CANSA